MNNNNNTNSYPFYADTCWQVVPVKDLAINDLVCTNWDDEVAIRIQTITTTDTATLLTGPPCDDNDAPLDELTGSHTLFAGSHVIRYPE